MKELQIFTVFVIFISLASVVGARTNCGFYSCPGPSDPPDRTRCCFWYFPTCCRAGGNTCRDSHSGIRNYCPGPNDGRYDTLCCTINNQPKCCSVWLIVGIVVPVGVLLIVILVVCCCWSRCPLAQRRLRRQMQRAGAQHPGAGMALPQWPVPAQPHGYATSQPHGYPPAPPPAYDPGQPQGYPPAQPSKYANQ